MYRYKYDPDSKKYTGKIECHLDPEATRIAGRDVFLIPQNTVGIEPPAPKEDCDIVWENGAWKYKEHAQPAPEEEYKPTELDLTREKLYTAENNLVRTDYISLKLTEALAVDDSDEVEALLEKYAEDLANRKQWRQDVSALRAQVAELEKESSEE